YYDNRLFVTSIDDWKARTYREQTGAHLEYQPDFDRFRGLAPTKLIIIDEPGRVEAMQQECRVLFGGDLHLVRGHWADREPQLTITRSKPIYLEFLHPGVHKGAGFEALCR